MSHYANKCFINSKSPQKLVVFLHGYNGSVEDATPIIDMLLPRLKSAAIVAPESMFDCEKNSAKKQWYSLAEFDKDEQRRSPELSAEEIMEIYNRYGDSLHSCAKQINAFIDREQDQYNITDENTFIMGFSQGAQLAIYAALSRKGKVGACISLSGVVAGKDKLAEDIISRPKVYMMHGTADISVQYQTLDSSLKWLHEHGIEVKDFRYKKLGHEMTDTEMREVAKVVNA